MFLGMVLVSENHVWHTGFILWTLLLCFIVRFISEYYVLNESRRCTETDHTLH